MSRIAALLILLFVSSHAYGEKARLAVAANFVPTMKQLVDAFHKTSAHQIEISSGSSGKFTTQIIQGAPYDMFFSADIGYVDKLIERKLAVENSKTIYALGQLVFWSNNPDRYPVDEESLLSPSPLRIAMANPKFAPYGQAAVQTLSHFDTENFQFITAENVAQSFHFIHSQNVDGGFVALSQVKNVFKPESYWIISTDYYRPIRQASVILKRSGNNQAVNAFSNYMKTDSAKHIIENFGYQVPAHP